MGFLNPLNLFYGLSLGLLILIYLNARSRSTLEVSSLMLFEEVEQPIAKPKLARVDLLFWLELATLAALSLAVAGLYLKLHAAPERIRRHALIFDTAASMGAVEGNRTRLDQAQRDALAIVSSAPASDQFSVITYAQEATLRHAASGDRSAIRAAIESLAAEAVAARPSAFAAALMLARESDSAELFADRLPAGATVPDSSHLRLHQIGTDAANLAIVSLDSGVPGHTQGRCTIRNFSSQTRTPELAIDCDGHEVYRSSVSIPARGQVNLNFGPLASGGLVHARLLTSDALEADNQRWTYATANRAFHVLIVSPDAQVRDDLARVVRAIDPNFEITEIDPLHLNGLADAHFDLALMHDFYDPGLHAASRLLIYPNRPPNAAPNRAGELSIGKSVPYCEMSERIDGGILTRPILLGAGRIITLPIWMEPIARGVGPGSVTMPIAAIGANRDGRLGVLAFDVRGHLLLDPDRIDALILTVEMIKSLAAPQGLYIVSSGTYVSVPATGRARVQAPDGSSTSAVADQWGQVRVRPLQAGRYQVSSAGGVQQIFANYYDADESDLESKPVTMHAGEPGAGEYASITSSSVRPITLLLITLAVLAFLSESALLAGRTIIGRRSDV